MLKISEYEDADREAVIALVLSCQNDGTRPLVSIDDQPELLSIREKYFSSGGSFWVAKDNDRVVGSIGVMYGGNGIGVLKKFFVHENYRGEPHHLGRKLFDTLLSFVEKRDYQTLILDTPKNTERAHRFYTKAGFKQVEKTALPIRYDYPYKESDFFVLNLKKSDR